MLLFHSHLSPECQSRHSVLLSRCVFFLIYVLLLFNLFLRFFIVFFLLYLFFFQAEDGIRDLVRSRGLGDVYKRQIQ